MKLRISIFILLPIISLHAMDQVVLDLSEAFNPETTFFDDVVNDDYKNYATHLAGIAHYSQPSGYATICQELSTVDLRDLCNNQHIKEKAKKYWIQMSKNPEFHLKYQNATGAYRVNARPETREDQFAKFKRYGTQILQEYATKEISKEMIISPNQAIEETQLLQLLRANRHIAFNEEQIANYKALILIQNGLRQIHRRLDPSTDLRT